MSYLFKTMAVLAVSLVLTEPLAARELVAAKAAMKIKKKKYANRRLLVRYKEETSPNKIAAGHFSVGAYVVKSFDIPDKLDVVEIAKGISIDDAQEFYREDPNVKYVEPDYEFHAFMEPPPTEVPPIVPSDPSEPSTSPDPRFSQQWGLNNTGQEGGTPDIDINAPELWENISGDDSIVIGVIDTGVNYNHPDLKENMWVNPNEIAGNNIDDDNNGVIDDIHGYNVIAQNGDPMDDHGHGTHCAGTIAARGKNFYGGSGVMQKAKIVGCKFLDESGGGSASDAIACLKYFADLGVVSITSNSWGGIEYSEGLRDAILAHQQKGILFVAAASNEGNNNDTIDTYPADYPLTNIISVAAFDRQGKLASFSNYGKRSVHVSAPGVEILSTVLDNSYQWMDGTSMAAPFAAGLAGMIKASRPELNFLQVKNLLIAGGVPDAELKEKTISGRRIRAVDTNGLGSLSCNNQIVSGRLSPPVDKLIVSVGEVVTLAALNINCAEANGEIVIPMSPSKKSMVLEDKGMNVDNMANDGVYSKDWKSDSAGHFDFNFPDNDRVRISVYDPASMKKYVASQTDFNYRTITGTSLQAHDDWAKTIETPFPIKFADSSLGFESLNIDSNGVMSFTDTKAIGYGDQEFPVQGFKSLIAVLWDDLNPSPFGGNIYYETLNNAPNREFVVEWRDVAHFSSGDGATFQVVFFENSSDILFNYLDIDFANPSINNGAQATIGIQSSPLLSVVLAHDSAQIQSRSSWKFSVTNE